ncbi:DUF6950 family protein [Asticcacaulis excentricus]|uniref:DUF6950 domain-containing protein n=1 Tax=Asticcacaulis excentricus (strain ATCC 15261 / DSM 4724 / KCTC 12464 / NCIMB 9791 / VKM B-1370 / CB 48) TaxID=573065 RepID=E8RPR5_ASTEC|nr:hypothetical protein [Asticcacaulis excentricus]ADU12042.1 hypothetical protein Astex_0344 [Asticcacaulis excentricus CB 48]
MSLELLARAQACDITIATYLPLAFELGRFDCARMAARHLKHMGHKVAVSKFGTYSTVAGALRALKNRNFDSLEAAFDSLQFDRIPPAMAIMGDIVAFPNDYPIPAMAVRLDAQNYLHAWQGGFAISELTGALTAWRVPCLRPMKG